MKNLILMLFLALSFSGFGQIEIEIFHPIDGYKILTNDTAQVRLELSLDSTKLSIHDGTTEAKYNVEKVNVMVSDGVMTPFTITEVYIQNDPHGLNRITMWEGMNLVLFEYNSHLTVLNSGEGISYP